VATPNKTFTLIGELTEDGQFISITHWKPLRRIMKFLVGKQLEVNVKELKYVRSDAQNRWLWGVAYITIVGWWKESFGEKIEKETLHSYTKQIIMGGKQYDTVAIQKDEFMNLIEEVLSIEKSIPEIKALVEANLKKWLVNVKVAEVAGSRVILDVEEKSTKDLNTKEFCDLKDLLQAHWAEKGCDIPDPRENNILSDFIKDE